MPDKRKAKRQKTAEKPAPKTINDLTHDVIGLICTSLDNTDLANVRRASKSLFFENTHINKEFYYRKYLSLINIPMEDINRVSLRKEPQTNYTELCAHTEADIQTAVEQIIGSFAKLRTLSEWASVIKFPANETIYYFPSAQAINFLQRIVSILLPVSLYKAFNSEASSIDRDMLLQQYLVLAIYRLDLRSVQVLVKLGATIIDAKLLSDVHGLLLRAEENNQPQAWSQFIETRFFGLDRNYADFDQRLVVIFRILLQNLLLNNSTEYRNFIIEDFIEPWLDVTTHHATVGVEMSPLHQKVFKLIIDLQYVDINYAIFATLLCYYRYLEAEEEEITSAEILDSISQDKNTTRELLNYFQGKFSYEELKTFLENPETAESYMLPEDLNVDQTLQEFGLIPSEEETESLSPSL